MSTAESSEHRAIAPMMRVLWQDVRDRINTSFAEDGYHDVRAEHLAVLQYPGPDHQRPSTLAARSGMSRQAINHLISHLVGAGYLERYTDPTNGSLRLIRLTGRGRRLYQRIEAVAAAVESDWAQEIGAQQVEQLRAILTNLAKARQH